MGQPTVAGGNIWTYYLTQVKHCANYYPFGLEIQNRTASSPSYRYGFNGKEKDQAGELPLARNEPNAYLVCGITAVAPHTAKTNTRKNAQRLRVKEIHLTSKECALKQAHYLLYSVHSL
jgi:hypothetical protein